MTQLSEQSCSECLKLFAKSSNLVILASVALWESFLKLHLLPVEAYIF